MIRRAKTSRTPQAEVMVHEDLDDKQDESEEEYMEVDESRDPMEESGRTIDDSDEDEDIDEELRLEMASFEQSFRGMSERYRLLNRIGEGTFSTVYKAEDLQYEAYNNNWDIDEKENTKWSTPTKKGRRQLQRRRPRYVAIKKIYVTSSPIRILNELELLHDLRDSDAVCPLITAFRHQDQVIAILPYFQHKDFREYFKTMGIPEMRLYFRSLFTALRSVHHHKILHRDIKPTNFLYSPAHARGVLVDFGLAERQGTDWLTCLCSYSSRERLSRQENSLHPPQQLVESKDARPSYPKTDQRPSRRANRAGTRGFRAPEVLLKCTMQNTSIDMWSAGVILLTFLARRFPFFHSADDIDALLEITNIFGRRKMRETAMLHGQIFDTNIPSYNENGYGFEKIVAWCTDRKSKKDEVTGHKLQVLESAEVEAIRFLERLLECDPSKRITAEEALRHSFITKAGEEEEDDDVDLVSLAPSGR